MEKRSKLQYIAIVLGWAYTGLLFGITIVAVFSPGNRLVLHFNEFGEIWADFAFFGAAFGLLTWFLFFKMLRRRKGDRLRDDNQGNRD